MDCVNEWIVLYTNYFNFQFSYLHRQDSAWVKKERNEDFDIQEICKLIGIYLRNKFYKLMNKRDFGLYREDGLGILRNTSGHEALICFRSGKSENQKTSENHENIYRMKTLFYLWNKQKDRFPRPSIQLNDKTYKPYRKLSNEPIYINK